MQTLSETIPSATNVYRLVTISGCHGGEGKGSGAAHLCRRRRLRHLRRYLSHAKVKDALGTAREGRRPTRTAGRRCLASTEIKNIDSHSHAGLHRSSIRFSPARQYPFFPRTVRGTNCSCIPPPSPLARSPRSPARRPPTPRRNPKHKGALFHLARSPTTLPPAPGCRSLNPRILRSSLSSCLRSLVRCDLSKCMET